MATTSAEAVRDAEVLVTMPADPAAVEAAAVGEAHRQASARMDIRPQNAG